MPPTATLITDGQRNFGEPPVLGFGRNGWYGRREWLVNTHDEHKAILSVPTPYGSPWSTSLPDLVVINLENKYIAKKDDPSAGDVGGLTVVRVDYAENELNGFIPPQANLKYTELGHQDETQTIYFDLDAPVTPGSPPAPVSWPLGSGDGFARKVGLVTALVHHFIPNGGFPDLSRIATLTRFKLTNTDSVALPRIIGTSVSPLMGVGQVQYEGFSHESVNSPQGKLTHFVHKLTLAPDHKVRWRFENEEGSATGPEIVSRVYDAASYSGLW
jgi:hypothetical protein